MPFNKIIYAYNSELTVMKMMLSLLVCAQKVFNICSHQGNKSMS